MNGNIRLFVGLPCAGASVLEALAPWWQDLPTRLARPVVADNLHVTLLFMGTVPSRDVPSIEERLADITAPPFTLVFNEAGLFGKTSLALTASCPPELDTLQKRVATTLEGIGGGGEYPIYRPHLTVARLKGNGQASQRARASLEEHLRGGPPLKVRFEEFRLYQTITQPGGVVYNTLRRFPLGID